MKTTISALISVALFASTSLSDLAAETSSSHSIFRLLPDTTALSDRQMVMLDLARQSHATTGVSVVISPTAEKMGGVGALSPDAFKIRLTLSANTTLTATRTRADIGKDVSTWRGSIDGDAGEVALMWWPDGDISGTVQHQGRLYSIRPMGDMLHAVVEMNEDLMPPEHPPVMLMSGGSQLVGPRPHVFLPAANEMHPVFADHVNVRRPAGADVTIDVLVAYTKKAASYYGDIRRGLIDPSIDGANESFRASNLGQIKLRLVHAYQTDYVEEGGLINDLWRFADKGDGYMEEVHELRDKYHADVAILIVDDPDGCGLATRVFADADEAFAVVHHECAATNYSIAHEIGHIIGARHDLKFDRSTMPFAYGHGFVNGTKWRDIMSYKDSCGGCPRLPVWSSPNVLVGGEPAGSAEQDNARVIAENASRVAAFR
jgi:hypothetical protein